MFGYLIIVSNDGKRNYGAMATLLALSIKKTQPAGYDNVAVVTDDEDQAKLFRALPYFDRAIFWNEKQHWDGRSFMDKLSPWGETVCLDADMIFTRDYSHWVDYFLENCELYIPSIVYTFRGDPVTSTYYRETFKKNDLPNLYSAYTYFNKTSELARDFFNLQRYIIDNPAEFKNLYLDKMPPEIVGTDEAFALAAKILDITDRISYPMSFPRFVHMKPMVQDFRNNISSTGIDLGYYFNDDNKIKIGQFSQTDILHYADKDLDVEKMIKNYEKLMFKGLKTYEL